MATSGSTDFSDSRSQIIADAFVRIGGLMPGAVPSTEQTANASREMNRILKSWAARGHNLWRHTEGSLTLVANQSTYTMGGTTPDFASRPLRVISARYKDASGNEIAMKMLSRDEYFELPQKTTSGVPVNFYYDPQRDQSKLFIWPVPSSVTTETLEFTYMRQFEDFDADADEPDMPQEWFDAMVWGLAARLALIYYPGNEAIIGRTKAEAAEALTMAESYDREPAPIKLSLPGSE